MLILQGLPNSIYFIGKEKPLKKGENMSLRLIYGRAGTGKSQYCYTQISNKIKQQQHCIIITPEQFSFTAEKRLLDSLTR